MSEISPSGCSSVPKNGIHHSTQSFVPRLDASGVSLTLNYEGEGKEEKIRILFPRGSYSVRFEWTKMPVLPGTRVSEEPEVVSRSPERGARWIVPTATILVIVAVLAVWLWHRRKQSRTPGLVGQPFATAVGEEFSPAISPDGRKIAYVWDGDNDNLDIYVRDIDGRRDYPAHNQSAGRTISDILS